MQTQESNGSVKMPALKRLKKNQDELSPDRFIRKYVKLSRIGR